MRMSNGITPLLLEVRALAVRHANALKAGAEASGAAGEPYFTGYL